MLPRTYYSNGSVLFEVKVNGGTPEADEVSWKLDLPSVSIYRLPITLKAGEPGGVALEPKVR